VTAYNLKIGFDPIGYDLASRVSAIRAHATYGAYFSDDSHPHFAGGLAVPEEPTINSTITVDNLADYETELTTGNSKRVILDPAFSPYTSTSTINITQDDMEAVMTGCVINGSASAAVIGVTDVFGSVAHPHRVKIVGGTINGGLGALNGEDVTLEGVTATGLMSTTSPNSSALGGVSGRRVAIVGCDISDFANGFFFVNPFRIARVQGTVVGDVLTITSVSHGTVSVDDTVDYAFGATGVSVTRGPKIAEFLTGTGTTGTYRLNQSATWTGTANLNVMVPSASLILANTSAECPNRPDGASWIHESVTRLNGPKSAVVIDSRLYNSPKAAVRAHPEFTGFFPTGGALYLNNQIEEGAVQIQDPGDSGVYPGVENFWLDENTFYNSTAETTMVVPRYSQLSNITLTGNGTLVTIDMGSAYVNSGFSEGEVVNIAEAINSAFNVTGVTLTVTGAKTATYPSTVVGTTTAVVNRPSKDMCENFWMMNNINYGVGVANDTAFLPGGYGAPAADWETVVDASTAYGNGNRKYTYVSTPAWEMA
jgi:hypothetical protein